jgi:hypothetical protein
MEMLPRLGDRPQRCVRVVPLANNVYEILNQNRLRPEISSPGLSRGLAGWLNSFRPPAAGSNLARW